MSNGEVRVKLPHYVSEDEARTLLAVKLFEVGRVSLGKAAEIAGYTKPAFIDVLGKYKVPVFNYGPEDLRAEFDE